MSLKAVDWANHQEAGGPLQKLILIFIADRAGMDGWWRGDRKLLVEHCEVSLAEVHACLIQLQGRELLQFYDEGIYLPAAVS